MAKKKAKPQKASATMGDAEVPSNEELQAQITALQTQVNTMQTQLSQAELMLQQYGIWPIDLPTTEPEPEPEPEPDPEGPPIDEVQGAPPPSVPPMNTPATPSTTD